MKLRFQKEPPKQDAVPIPDTPGARFRYVWSTHFFRLLGANLLCVLFCLPVVTVPAALCGLNAVLRQYLTKGYGDVFPTFWQEFRCDFLKRLAAALPLFLLPVGAWFLGGLFSSLWSYALCAPFLVLALLASAWLFPQLSRLTLSPFQALRNSILLSFLESRNNLLILLLELVSFALILIPWPFSSILLATCIPVLPMMLISFLTDPVLDKRIIRENSKTSADL